MFAYLNNMGWLSKPDWYVEGKNLNYIFNLYSLIFILFFFHDLFLGIYFKISSHVCYL